ncbi:MAG TPA: methyltransferase [Bacteroidales bacterium]|nr:methyltransferase [Bacteroidales bacterium]
MNKSMTLFGCGPKLALMCLPYIILSLSVMFVYPEFFSIGVLDNMPVKMAGFIWLGLGCTFWIYSAIYFLKNFKPGELITSGPFSLCRNPIYASIIVFIIPSLALIFHSGLLFTIAIVLYIGFKLSIHGETIVLRRIFGEKYEKYEESVNEIFPFPRFLTISK